MTSLHGQFDASLHRLDVKTATTPIPLEPLEICFRVRCSSRLRDSAKDPHCDRGLILQTTIGATMAFDRQPALLTLILILFTTQPATANGRAGGDLCRSVPDIIDEMRHDGTRIAYSEGLLRSDMLVRSVPSTSLAADRLQQLVAPHGLTVEKVSDGTLMIVPGPDMDAETVRERREQGRTLLQRETSLDALPAWEGQDGFGISWVEITFDGAPANDGSERALPDGLGSETRHVVITVDVSDTDPSLTFHLKQLIVDAGARARGARFGLQGERETIERLVDDSLAPYVDGYVFEDEAFIPQSDDTGRPWWRARQGNRTLLHTLLEGAERGAAIVLVDDAFPSPGELQFLEAIKNTRAGLMARSPATEGQGRTPVTFLDPKSGSYFVALDLRDDSRRINLTLEPMASAEVVYPRGGEVAWESYGPTTSLQLDASSQRWFIELVPRSASARSGRMLVENEVIVDPYEVVVANQIFQQRERNKVLSLDVMEYATIVPLWREGRQSRWEHRIIRRRGWLDEYHHLNLWRDGVKVPHDKLYKGILGRPIDRIEMSPLEVENRKTYRYRYLGQEELEGHPTWKIGFEPVVPGRLMSGTVWIDQQTGAHRRIKTRHHGLGIGILAGEYTTNFEWIPGEGSCHWDWRERRGSETIDYLDFAGSYNIEYERTNFTFNRPDIEDVVESSHASDILIHVATPPDGHRWLLRGAELERRRGDQPYGPTAVLREGDDCRGEPNCPDGVEPVVQNGPALGTRLEEDEEDVWNAGDAVLAGIHAFPSRSRVSFGFSGGSGPTETQSLVGFNYVNFDLFGRGRRGKGELYLWIGGFEDDGLISITDPELFGSAWSLTTSFDVRFDPEQDSLFRLAERPQSDSDDDGGNLFRDLSLDTQRTSVRLSASRSLTGSLSARFLYTFSDLDFERRATTDSDFVLPLDTAEHVFGTEITLTRGSLRSELSVSHGRRSDWRAWGLAGQEEPESSYTRAGLQISMARAIAGTQTLGLAVGLHRGWNVDRFSRTRLFQVDGRVPGYSSSIGFDEGVVAAFSYNFNIWKLPLRLRFDAADISYDEQMADLVDQQLLGAQLNLNLHGPWETDWTFGVGRGLYAEPEREEQTFYWVVTSRRFGRQ